jgi:adenosylhomocysteine nucleosidase
MPPQKSHKFLLLTALAMEAKAIEATLPREDDRWKLQIIGIRGVRLRDVLDAAAANGGESQVPSVPLLRYSGGRERKRRLPATGRGWGFGRLASRRIPPTLTLPRITGGGDKKESAEQGIDGGLNENFTAIILAGLAGALDPTLKIGDIVIDATAAGPITDWPKLAGRYGKIHSSQSLISTSRAKAELFASTGALAVDMESAIVQRYAQSAGLPLLMIRAISDTADQEVPLEVMSCIDELGNPRAAALAGKLARHPSLIPKLMRLGQQSRIALENLGKTVAGLFDPGSH